MPEAHHAILGTAGHIDHGKSSLVRALSGTDPDRLPEEKKRGVTIELGFAHLSLPDVDNDATYELGIVDVPGHTDFVGNMVAGVGGMNLALFAVAADDGWMPQSEEHLQILHYLGVPRIVIALTKADLSEDIEFACEFVRESIKNSPYAEAPIVPVSSHTSAGMDELKATLVRELRDLPRTPDYGKPVLPVDRAFTIKGMGTVITGTLLGGKLHVGDVLACHRGAEEAHVRSIQNHSRSVETALPGMRTALNLPDFQVGSRKKLGIHRGSILVAPGTGAPSDTLDVHLTRLARPIPGQPETGKPLRSSQQVRVHYGSGSVGARILFGEGQSLAPGESGVAQLRLEDPLFTMMGDRLVIRDWSGRATMAGGVILDPVAKRRGFRTSVTQNHLGRLASVIDDPSAAILEKLSHVHLLSAAALSQRLKLSPEAFQLLVQQLTNDGGLVPLAGKLAHAGWWQNAMARAKELVEDFHKANPDLAGLPLQDFRQALTKSSLPPEVIPLLEEALAADGYPGTGTNIARAGFTPGLPDDLAAPVQEIEEKLAATPLNPPGYAELGQSSPHRRAIAFLVRIGRVVKFDDKAVLLTSARDEARARVLAYLDTHGKATASELRQHLDSTRRIVMPLLEEMDAEGLTRRDGDHRYPA